MTRVKFSRWFIALSLIVALLATNLSHVSVYAADSAPEKIDYWKFERVPVGSHELSSGSNVHQGQYALNLTFNAETEPNKFYLAKQNISVEPNTNYVIQLWAKGDSVEKAWFGGGPGWGLRSTLAGTYDWKEFSVNYKTGASQTTFEFLILVEGKTTNLWIDDVSMVKQGTDSNLVRNGNFEAKSLLLSANPASGEVRAGTQVSLSVADQEAMIFYTTDGSDPNDSMTVKQYEQPFTIDRDMQIKAYVKTSDGSEIEPIAFNYTVIAGEGEQLLDFASYLETTGKGRKVPIFKTDSLQIDGDWDKWDGFTGILLPSDKERQVKMSDWKGLQDSSAEIKFAYDDEALYIAAKVEDDIHYPVADGDMWVGDSLQIAFTHDSELYGPEYGFNVLKDSQEQIWRWSDGVAKLSKEAVDYHVSRSGTLTLYEAKLPWKAIFADKPDSKVSMTLLVNDNDGNGRKGVVEWTGAIVRGKNPKDMAELLLLQKDEEWTVILDGPVEYAAGFEQQYNFTIPNVGRETLTLTVNAEQFGLKNEEIIIPGGKVWTKKLPLTMNELGSHTLAVSAQPIAGQLGKQDQLIINVLANPQDLAAQFEQWCTKLPALATLLTTAEAAGLAVDYEWVNYTIIDQFIDYGLEDINREYYDRASYVLEEIVKLYEEATDNVQAYISGEKTPFAVDRYVTGSIDIDKTAFIADTRSSISDETVRKPVVFTGYGHFGQAKKDIPLFKGLGTNMVSLEIGPNSVIKPKESFTDWNIEKTGVSAQAVRDLNIGHGESGGSLRISNQTPKSPGKFIDVWQEVTIEPNTTYEIKVWAKGEDVNNAWFPGGPGWGHRSLFPQGTFDWQEFTYEYKSGQNDSKFRFMIASENVTQNLWIDDIRMYVKNGSGENLIVNGNFDENKFVELGSDDYVGDIILIQKNVIKHLQEAEENDVAAALLLSPHYFPAWALEKWPELRSDSAGFIKFTINNPRARQIMEDYLRLVIPLIKDYKSLHSIILSNESVYQSYMDEANTTAWQEYLEDKYAGNIATLNALHRTNYAKFSDIPLPNKVSRTPAFYDWVKFNNKLFSDWHRWMADIIHEIAPNIPVHAKIMKGAQNDIGNLTWGVDPEDFSELSQINGNDNSNIYGRNRNFTSELKFYDLQASMKEAPIFNSEHHIIVDGEERYIPEFAPHVRSVLWQGAIHGLSAAAIWVWERTYDQNSDFKGSILHRPDVVAAVGRTHLDLSRLVDEVTAFQQEKADAAILYSIPAVIYDIDNPAVLDNAYEAISYNGLKVGFVSENQIENGALENIKTLFIPNAKHVQESTFNALKPFVENGGKLVVIGNQALSFDEYDRPLSTVERDALLQHEETRLFPATATSLELRNAMTSELDEQGLIDVQLMDAANNELVFETEWRSVQHNGKLLINATNYTWNDRTVKIFVNGEPVTSWKNLITGESHTSGQSLLLMAHEPVLLELNLSDEETVPIVHGSDPQTPIDPSIKKVSKEELKHAEDGRITILLGEEHTAVLLPSEAAQLPDHVVIELKNADGATIVLPAALLTELSSKGESQNGGGFRVNLHPADATTAQNQAMTSDLTGNSPLFTIGLTVLGSKGEENQPSQFPVPITIKLPYEMDKLDAELLGIYYYNEKLGSWEYVGGKVDKKHGNIEAEVLRPGQYKAMLRDKRFSDVAKQHWAFRTLQILSAKHLISGVSEERFNPEGATTRAEFTALLVRTLGLNLSETATAPFSDVPAAAWYADYITAAHEAGIVRGVSESQFAPNERITREQMAALTIRAYEYLKDPIVSSNTELNDYSDAKHISPWAVEAINKAVSAGLMKGKATDRFDPRANATRAEAAQLIYNLLQRY